MLNVVHIIIYAYIPNVLLVYQTSPCDITENLQTLSKVKLSL